MEKQVLSIFPHKYRHLVLKLNALLKNPRLWTNWNRNFAIEDKPVLLLSMPRSGSSWLGEVLAQSRSIRYLREPITSVYMKSAFEPVSFFIPDKCLNHTAHDQAVTNAFTAKLNYFNSVLHNKNDWLDPTIKRKLLIKEINPLCLDYFQGKFDIKVIYLERCPYAIAKSFDALNWRSEELFSRRFDLQTLEKLKVIKDDLFEQCFFYQMGFLQGVISAIVEPSLKLSDCIQVSYENLILDTQAELKKIADFLSIDNMKELTDYIVESFSDSQSANLGSFSTKRNKHQLIDRIRNNKLEKEYLITLQAYELGFYGYKNYDDD
ncbi:MULTISPECIES: sulfotransferase domain-containing protein [Pseudoalteromonas]|uniref:sulfotransferase domain-containing protein n=1 Tax=Pseudoalteromonas TaxID=53246 RepID=UPI001583C5FF|nr:MULTISPECIES: sulfotransferase domain-containing protein [Pseudoalteromonas]MDI4652074.1 sulfotransferase domain-containing protein [Pseudoalteromonas shioyasakiensis]NUJ38399.1 sulfotransferase domain-containing protein [Pseudoalteromonas sp. 0303]